MGGAEGVLLAPPDGEGARDGAPLRLSAAEGDSDVVEEPDADARGEAEAQRDATAEAVPLPTVAVGDPLRLRVRVVAGEGDAAGVSERDPVLLLEGAALRVLDCEREARLVALCEPLSVDVTEGRDAADALRRALPLRTDAVAQPVALPRDDAEGDADTDCVSVA